MHPGLRLLLVTLLILLASNLAAGDTRYMQVRVFIDSREDLTLLKEMSLDRVARGDGYIEIVTHPEEFQRLEEMNLRMEVIHDDLTAFYRSRLDITRDMGGYKTLSEIYAHVDSMINEHKNIVGARVSIGQTIEGRDQWALKISDNPTLDEDEPEVLYTAAIHAREVITPEVLLYFMDYITDNYGVLPEVTDLVNNRELWFVVVVNPDGYYHNEVTDPGGGGMWRKNRRDNGDGSFGVDLNRNFGYEWGYDDEGSAPYPSDPTYRGIGPFSEPETQNMRDFIIGREFVITMYYHSYQNLIIWPWGYDYFYTPDNDVFAAMGDSMAAMNGYGAIPISDFYVVNGGTDDWGYGEQTLKNKNLAMSIEVGGYSDGFWPSTSRIPDLIEENLGPNLFLARMADNPYKLRLPAPPVVFIPDTVDSFAYDVVWSHDDSLNPALSYELVELQGFQLTEDSANTLTNWENNQFSLSSSRSHSAPTSFYSGSGSNFSRWVKMSSPFNVDPDDSLKIWMYYDIETNWDYAYVEVSTDGTTFTPIAGNVTTNYDPNGENRGNGITGSSGGWTHGLFDLSAYVGQSVQIRVSYYTDSYVDEEGIYIDDIFPVEGYATETVISSSLTDTVYSFTDKPAGVYYYKVRARDAEDQWGPFSSIAETYVSGSDYICHDADGDGYGDPGYADNMCPPDNCPAIYNPDQADFDSDTFGDVCDNCPETANADQLDTDNDTFGDVCDNCPETANADQLDTDSDTFGDVCDNCPEAANADQLDTDNDTFGDVCDVCPEDPENDIDTDAVCGDVDNCPEDYNPDQFDTDGDGVGDACCCAIRGDIDHSGGQIDISDIVMLVEFMFNGGSTPPCPEETDLDQSGGDLDIADLVYLVDYMFAGGPEPSPCL